MFVHVPYICVLACCVALLQGHLHLGIHDGCLCNGNCLCINVILHACIECVFAIVSLLVTVVMVVSHTKVLWLVGVVVPSSNELACFFVCGDSTICKLVVLQHKEHLSNECVCNLKVCVKFYC